MCGGLIGWPRHTPQTWHSATLELSAPIKAPYQRTTARIRACIGFCGEVNSVAPNGPTRIAGIVLLVSATSLAAGTAAGCHGQHPDDRAAVYQTLSQHDLSNVEVFEDRDHGVITLKGIVGSGDSKNRAEQLTRQAAPGYTVQDQLTLDNTGIMGMAKPDATRPGIEEVAPPALSSNSRPTAATPAKPGHRH